MREAVRSGRRANFYITENSFIDDYARDVGDAAFRVYHVLLRHANCETHSTWIGTARVAELLNLDQRTIQRAIKKLESLKLIRIARSANLTTYFLVPVPAPTKTAPIPLFDEISEVSPVQVNHDHMGTTLQSRAATTTPPTPTFMSHNTTFAPQEDDISVAAYKEEQDLLNKTSEQEGSSQTLFGQISEIASLHPGVDDPFRLSEELREAIKEAIARDGRDVVWVGTKSMREKVEDWPKAEWRFMPSPLRYFRESQYRKIPDFWNRSGNGKPKQSSKERLQRELDILRQHLK